jgi:hypothetical protein
MKKTLMFAVAMVALLGALLGTAATATATPGKSVSCTHCHARRTTVAVKVTRVSGTATTVTYKVSVTGGKGQAGWAVLSNGKNLAHRTAATGTFKVAKGRSIRVWAVKKGTGSNYRALVAK